MGAAGSVTGGSMRDLRDLQGQKAQITFPRVLSDMGILKIFKLQESSQLWAFLNLSKANVHLCMKPAGKTFAPLGRNSSSVFPKEHKKKFWLQETISVVLIYP